MTNNSKYPNTPGSRRSAPETSREAAESIAPIAKSHRALVLAVITASAERGLTGDEVAAECELTVHQTRSRISELKAAKLIADSERRDRLGSGRRGTVWVLKRYAPTPDDPQGDLLEAA